MTTQPEPSYYRNPQSADVYFASQLYATDWTGASDADKRNALIMASQVVDRLAFKGVKNSLYDALIAAGGDATKTSSDILASTTMTDLEIQTANELQIRQFPRDGTTGAQTWELTIDATGGNFTLTFNGLTTSSIAYNATAATIQTALEVLATVSAGDLLVTVSTGGTDAVGPYTITAAGNLVSSKYDILTATDVDLAGNASAQVAIINDNVPDYIAFAVFEEARELLSGRDPQQEYRNLVVTSDNVVGSTAMAYRRAARGPNHTIHLITSPRAWQYLQPYLDSAKGSLFSFKQV